MNSSFELLTHIIEVCGILNNNSYIYCEEWDIDSLNGEFRWNRRLVFARAQCGSTCLYERRTGTHTHTHTRKCARTFDGAEVCNFFDIRQRKRALQLLISSLWAMNSLILTYSCACTPRGEDRSSCACDRCVYARVRLRSRSMTSVRASE